MRGWEPTEQALDDGHSVLLWAVEGQGTYSDGLLQTASLIHPVCIGLHRSSMEKFSFSRLWPP